MSLRIKATLCLLVVIVLLVALVQLYFGNAIRSVLIRHANEYHNANFVHAKDSVEIIVEQVLTAGNTLGFNEMIVAKANGLRTADSWSRYENNAYVWQEMRSVRNVMLPKYVVDLCIMTPGGTVSYMDYDSMSVLEYPEAIQAPWYGKLNDGIANGIWLTPTSAYMDTQAPGTFFTYAQRIWGEYASGTPRGLLLINIDADSSFQKMLDGLAINERGALYLFNETGRLICSTESGEGGAKLSDFDFGVGVRTHGQDGTAQSFQYQSSSGLAHANHVRIRNTDWTLVQTMPYDLLLRETNDIQARFIYIIISIGAAVLLIAMAAMTPTLRALSSVAERTQEISHGNFNRRLALERKDEIGELAAAVDHMASDIAMLLLQLKRENEQRNQLNLEMLKSQLDPHFLFNALNSIKCIAAINEYEIICRMITDLSYLLESALGKNDEFTTLREELEFTAHYVALQQIRFNEFGYALDVADDILDHTIPRLILQPLIENSIRHGFLNNPIDGEILIQARCAGGYLAMSVADNGVGMDAADLRGLVERESSGDNRTIGLKNIRTRLSLHYGGAYTEQSPAMAIDKNAEGGITVTVRVPLAWEVEVKENDSRFDR